MRGSYAVKEIFYTVQGEGINSGRPAVFCRFAGCNLWSGREEDRADGPGSCSRWCDTDFVGGERIGSPGQLAIAIRQRWPGDGRPFVVLTGGEPTLQADEALISELKLFGFEIAIETNGTRPTPQGIDWITVSPKAGTEVVQRSGSELKVIVPQKGIDLEPMELWDFRYFLVQPLDGAAGSLETAIAWAMARPRWRVSLQAHKIMGVR